MHLRHKLDSRKLSQRSLEYIVYIDIITMQESHRLEIVILAQRVIVSISIHTIHPHLFFLSYQSLLSSLPYLLFL